MPKKAGLKRLKFSASLHPRGSKGQFIETADKVKPSKARQNAKLAKSTVKAAKSAIEVNRARKQLLDELDDSTKTRLIKVLNARKAPVITKQQEPQITEGTKGKKTKRATKAPKTPEAELQDKIDKLTKTYAKNLPKVTRDRIKAAKLNKETKAICRRALRLNEKGLPMPHTGFTVPEMKQILGKGPKNTNLDRADQRPVVNRDSLKFHNGTLTVWRDTAHSKYKGGFKESRDKDFEYSVVHNGEKLTLNKQTRVMTFEGEVVKGVPSMNARLRELDNKRLVDDLAINMRYVEAWDNKKVAVPSPRWDVVNMGGRVDSSLLAKEGYGGMELHHINQWVKVPFDSIVRDVDSGKMSLDEAKDIMRSQLRPNPNITSGYEIAAADKGVRAFVVLPGGAHNCRSGLYEANHPVGIHPDTGQLSAFGIAAYKKGSEYGLTEGREYGNKLRDGFWGEYRRREVFVIQGELNRRIQKGLIKPEEIGELFTAAAQRQQDAKNKEKVTTNVSSSLS